MSALSISSLLSLSTQPCTGTAVSSRPVACCNATSMQPGRLNSAEILRGQKTVEINHNGSIYRLQATRLGKLILTK